MRKVSLEGEKWNTIRVKRPKGTIGACTSWAVGQHLGEGARQPDRLWTQCGVALPARHNDTKGTGVCIFGLRHTPSSAEELFDGLVVLLAIGSLFCNAET